MFAIQQAPVDAFVSEHSSLFAEEEELEDIENVEESREQKHEYAH